MADILRGQIWLVNLDPTIGHEIKKSRPCLIIQNDIGNKYSPVTIIAPITSKNTDRELPFEVLIRTKNLELRSKILLNQIRAIDKVRLIKKLDKLNNEKMNKVNEALKLSLGLIDI